MRGTRSDRSLGFALSGLRRESSPTPGAFHRIERSHSVLVLFAVKHSSCTNSCKRLQNRDLREVRGMAILDAWLDNWDVRWGNNRLSLTQEKDGTWKKEDL